MSAWPAKDAAGPSKGTQDSPRSNGVGTMGFRVIVTTGLATLYLAGCLAALSLLFSMWSPSL